MKLKRGQRIQKRTRDVIIGYDDNGEPVMVKMQAIRIGLNARIESEIPDPTPPLGPVHRDAKGRVIKDERGLPKQDPVYEDPDHIAETARRANLRGIAMIYYSICPGEIDFELDEQSHRDRREMVEFFSKIERAMIEANISSGAMADMLIAATDLAQVTKDDLRGASEEIGRDVAIGEPGKERKVFSPN